MPNALITGSSACASGVVAALRRSGFEPLCADSAMNLVQVCASVPPKSLDCYVQFPDDHVTRTTAVAEASAMVNDRGMARYQAVTTVGPLLAEGATVVLVIGERASDQDRSPELVCAVNGLTRVLARAVREDYDSIGVRVALVEDGHSPTKIASIAARGDEDPAPGLASYIDVEPALGFAEWRVEVLSLLEVGQ